MRIRFFTYLTNINIKKSRYKNTIFNQYKYSVCDITYLISRKNLYIQLSVYRFFANIKNNNKKNEKNKPKEKGEKSPFLLKFNI